MRPGILVAAIVLAFAPAAPAKTPQTELIKGIIEVIDKAAEASQKLADAIEHNYGKAIKITDEVRVRSSNEKLREYLIKFRSVHDSQNAMISDNLSRFLMVRSDENWDRFKVVAANSGQIIVYLADDIKLEDGLIVLSDYFVEYKKAIDARKELIEKFKNMPKPQTDEEINAVRRMHSKYIVLMRSLDSLNNNLTKYLQNVYGLTGKNASQ